MTSMSGPRQLLGVRGIRAGNKREPARLVCDRARRRRATACGEWKRLRIGAVLRVVRGRAGIGCLTSINAVVQSHLETVLALADDPTRAGLPGYAERRFRKYLACGSLAHGFARAYRSECGHDFLVAFSCKGCAICRSRTTRRMAESAAHPRTGLWWKQNHAKRCLTNRDSRTIDIATLG